MSLISRRERIMTTISHKEPDRVPIGFDILEPLKSKLLEFYGISSLPELYSLTGVDCFSVWDWPSVQPVYTGPVREGITEYDRSAAYGVWGKVGEIIYPLADKELDEYRWPSVEDFDFSGLMPGLLEVRNMDMTTASGHAGAGWLHHVQMRGYRHALFDVLDDAWMQEYIRRNREFLIPYFEKLFYYAGGLIDIIRSDEDLGGHENMLISPELWRKWYKPLWTEIFDICHSNGARIWLHSCGYCRDVIPDFIEMGVDILNPLPPYVRGSDPADMKKTFGSQLTFDGGVDQMNVLVQGTQKQVAEEVKKRIDQLAHGGGYIAGPSQVFTRDVPLKNVVAFFEAVLKYGRRNI
jgi:Uroporphyrinogen-III decarboxylase